jgi:hypothetical protein
MTHLKRGAPTDDYSRFGRRPAMMVASRGSKIPMLSRSWRCVEPTHTTFGGDGDTIARKCLLQTTALRLMIDQPIFQRSSDQIAKFSP